MATRPLFFRRRRGSTSLEVAVAAILLMTGFVYALDLAQDIILADTIDRVHAAVLRKAARAGAADEATADFIRRAAEAAIKDEGLDGEITFLGAWVATTSSSATPSQAITPLPSGTTSTGREPIIRLVRYRHVPTNDSFGRTLYVIPG